MKLSQDEIEQIVRAVEGLEFGRVIIEVNARYRKVDVITECRQRLRTTDPVDAGKGMEVESG